MGDGDTEGGGDEVSQGKGEPSRNTQAGEDSEGRNQGIDIAGDYDHRRCALPHRVRQGGDYGGRR